MSLLKNNVDTFIIVVLVLSITLIPAWAPQWFVSPTGNISVMKIPAFFVIIGFVRQWKKTAHWALFLYGISLLVSLHLVFFSFDKGAGYALLAVLHAPLLYLLYKKAKVKAIGQSA